MEIAQIIATATFFANLSTSSKAASNAIQVAIRNGGDTITKEEKDLLISAQNLLDRINRRTGQFETQKFIESQV